MISNAMIVILIIVIVIILFTDVSEWFGAHADLIKERARKLKLENDQRELEIGKLKDQGQKKDKE